MKTPKNQDPISAHRIRSSCAGMRSLRFLQLSAARRALVRLCQCINFGELRDLEIRDGDPLLEASSKVTADLRLDGEDGCRPELHLPDFELCQELHRLFAHFDAVGDGRITRLEIRAGLPRRVLVESAVERVLP